MASDLFKSMNRIEPNSFMHSLVELKSRGGDPNMMIQQMLNSGRITQAQYNSAVRRAQQIMSMLGK